MKLLEKIHMSESIKQLFFRSIQISLKYNLTFVLVLSDPSTAFNKQSQEPRVSAQWRARPTTVLPLQAQLSTVCEISK